jgi:hypothetical protein
MPLRPSITYWQRVEPSPRSDSLAPGLAAAVRDPLWFLTRQWQLGELQGEDAASPAWTTLTLRSSTLDSWTSGPGDPRTLDGGAPLEAVVEAEPATPDRRTAVELGQAWAARRGSRPPRPSSTPCAARVPDAGAGPASSATGRPGAGAAGPVAVAGPPTVSPR